MQKVMVLSQAQARPAVTALAVLALAPFLWMVHRSTAGAGDSAACDDLPDLGPAPRELKGRSVLVTGGAGFIGSHAAMQLLEEGWTVTILDNLSRGNMGAVRVLEAHAKPGQLSTVIGDIGDRALVERVLVHSRVDIVMHFAAIAFVGESTREPLRYWHNITSNTLGLLEAMDRAGVRRLIYSSTCATYGNAEEMPITEQTPTVPVNPYAHRQLEIVLLLCALLTAAGRVGTVRPSSLRRM
jgi:UDP-glucose 4-epimerase